MPPGKRQKLVIQLLQIINKWLCWTILASWLSPNVISICSPNVITYKNSTSWTSLYHLKIWLICPLFYANPSLCHSPLLGNLSCSFTPHIHLTILISAHWSATSFSFLMGQSSLPCNILLYTQLLYNLPLTDNDISLLVSNGTNYLNLFHPIRILASTAAPASPTTLNMLPK